MIALFPCGLLKNVTHTHGNPMATWKLLKYFQFRVPYAPDVK